MGVGEEGRLVLGRKFIVEETVEWGVEGVDGRDVEWSE